MRLPIWLKLPLAFALIIALAIWTGKEAITGVRAIATTTTDRMKNDAIPGIVEIAGISYLIALERGDFWRLHAVAHNPEQAAKIKASLDGRRPELEAAFKRYEDSITNDKDRANFKVLTELCQDYTKAMDRAIAADLAGNDAQFHEALAVAIPLFSDRIQPLLSKMLVFNIDTIHLACEENLTLSAQVEQQITLGTWILAGLGTLCAVVACVAILPPLARIRRLMGAMAIGSIPAVDTHRPTAWTGRDEISDMGDASLRLGDYLRTMAGSATAIASGDLTITPTSQGRQDVLGNAFVTMHGQLSGDIRNLGGSASSLASATQEMTAVAAQLSASAEEASAQTAEVSSASEQVHQSVDSVAAAMEEMEATVKEIAMNTNQMTTQIRQTSGVAAELAKAGEQVGDIVTSMQMTADRTNLLALNATIEAASAGEAGRGFAVVAHEVKELAKQSLESAREATRILGQMGKQANEVNTLTSSVSQTVISVAAAIEQQSATVSDVGRSMHEASKGVAQIAASITELAGAGKQVAEAADQIRSSVEEVAAQAQQINSMVGHFRLAERDPGRS